MYHVALVKLEKSHMKNICKLNLATKVWQYKIPSTQKISECIKKVQDVDSSYNELMKLKRKGYKFYTIICYRKRDKLCYTEIYKNDWNILGYVVFRPDKPIENRRAYIEYYVDAKFKRYGIGTKTMEHIKDIAKNDLKLHKILADPASANTASIRLLEKTNWSFVGELKAHERYLFKEQWDDIRLYEYLLE